jgi:hypothetical protein
LPWLAPGAKPEERPAMPFPPEAPAKIRQKIGQGLLPRKPFSKMWAGQGTGETCAGCDQPIRPDQIEYEFGNGGIIRMHLGCAALWEKERAQVG